ncbi:MAG: hypothetical protein ABL962_03620 [Fimbriimonadaceae bacterium]
MLIQLVFASALLVSPNIDAPVQKTGKWGLIKKVVGKGTQQETYYGSLNSATISEGSFEFTDTPIKPGVLTKAKVSITWDPLPSELTPGDTPLTFNIAASGSVSEKDYNLMNVSCWYRFDGFGKLVEETTAFVGHAPSGFIGNSKGTYRVIVPKGEDGKELFVMMGQTGIAFGVGRQNMYPCQYTYKWNTPPMDPKDPNKPPVKKPEEEKKPDPNKEKMSIVAQAFDYRPMVEKARSDDELKQMLAYTEQLPVEGVAADGASLILLRVLTNAEGRATFQAPSVGGGLSAISDSNLYRSRGAKELTMRTEMIDGRHCAFALFRPPDSYGTGDYSKPVSITVDMDFNDEKYQDPKSTFTFQLVRPPVVLVHGTYDKPFTCFQQHEEPDESPLSMEDRLRKAGYQDIYSVDWEDTNGSKDPSSFITNDHAVWQNKDGIQTALDAMRRRRIAVTQADLVCHSQGGVIARVYARGYNLKQDLPACHLADPVECRSASIACWYHRKDNHWAGDIHRLITISTTHRGSEVCRLFNAFAKYPKIGLVESMNRTLLDMFLVFVDKTQSGITTEGFLNQTPDSDELKQIGPTPVPSHAIGCVATDEDMWKTRPDGIGISMGMGNYYGKLYKIWKLTPDDAKQEAFDYLGKEALKKGNNKPQADADEYRVHASQLDEVWPQGGIISLLTTPQEVKDRLDAVIFHMRKTVFLGDENDCTVSFTSSKGGLKAPFITKAEHVLHGWAPRYVKVQDRVVNLLRDNGDLFDRNGFPDYNGKQSSASKFLGNAPNPPTTQLFNRGGAGNDSAIKTVGAVAGAYTTVYGEWEITQNGAKVTGRNKDDVESLEGTLLGRVLKFTYIDGDKRSSGEVTFSEDWKSFEGSYFDSAGVKWPFKGERKASRPKAPVSRSFEVLPGCVWGAANGGLEEWLRNPL